ncbi:hypothetical protein DMUE_0237 [Dictyocoela muelleri]|nr:hypothetical protein DMUE_0237 [Dictyocoela muelleri]
MKRKTEKAYNIVFSFLKQKLEHSTKLINIDFETALYSAIEKNFRESSINGCSFHLSQIFLRFIKKNHGNIYKYNEDYRRFVKYIYFLAFIPKEQVNFEFEKICLLKKMILATMILFHFSKEII